MSLFLHNCLRGLLKIALVFVALTFVGQIPFAGATLESRYHDVVNSDGFQKGFQVVIQPVVWTGGKIKELIVNTQERSARETRELRSR